MNGFLISNAIEQLSREFGETPTIRKLCRFLLKGSWSPEDRQTILNLIAQSLTTLELTEAVAEYFSPILLDLFGRIAQTSSQLTLFCTLSRLIGHYACATNFTYEQFGSGFFSAEKLCFEASNNENLQTLFIESCYVFLNYDSAFFQSVLDWSFVSRLIASNASSKGHFKWTLIKIYEILLQIDCTHSELSKFDEEEAAKFQLRCFNLATTRILKFSSKSIHYGPVECSNGAIFDCDFSSNVVSVYGILLQRFKPLSSSTASDVIILPSVEANLQTAALGVSLGKPILVEGPMGSGKTTLIRQLARLTGREKPPDVLTVQISDQVDSKYLLGSYICSEVPGEFLFNLGPLLRAIQSGSWLVLEDIDFASSDVISLVTSIVESKTASSIPGCENKIDKFDGNFRIFFTRRVSSGSATSGEANNYSLMSLLGRACSVVSISNLDLVETSQLIEQKWPSLKTIIPKIIEIYQNLTLSDKVSVKRYITLRDLIKWCTRLANYYSLNSSSVAEDAFLDAVDVFASFSSNADLFTSKSLTLSSSLNITKAVCEQLLTRRTPNIERNGADIVIGRQKIDRYGSSNSSLGVGHFAYTTQSLQLLERLAVCVYNGEAVLLCGETGVGKTSCIQYLASLSGKALTVINMNQQSDSVELFGGYKPIDIKFLVNSARDEYQSLFSASFNSDKNATFMAKFIKIYNKRDWKSLVKIMMIVCDQGIAKTSQDKKEELQFRWRSLKKVLTQIEDHLANKSELTFAFMEGALTRAVKEGHWVLLDEINLAEYETLQSLLTMLDKDASFLLFEKANDQAVQVHPDFRLFACMNPATDIGKRELPIGIQNRFTEFYISEICEKGELRKLVATYIGSLVPATMVEAIVDFYTVVKAEAASTLKDINGYRPIYSLRNLCRALRIAGSNPFHSVNRSIYESFCLAFLSNLDTQSAARVQQLIEEKMFAKKLTGLRLQKEVDLPNPEKYVQLDDCPYPIVKGPNETFLDETYIRTATVQKNLRDISRIIFAGKTLPILLQGETSVGKTSLITWLARATGNVCIRVNNHEHTDLQEYVGSYSSDATGKILFKEGVLVEAMRKGYWLILDELNLAPTEVLEALNRVLDDNRELFIPETQEVIKAHPRFLLFATQNPPGRYGGRKVLSRAFRNRFIELHFSEIPSEELITILHLKCRLPKSYAKRMVEVLLELQRRRSKSDIFAGKHGLITLRDLFRWGYRYMKFSASEESSSGFFDWDEFLANQGFMLLAGRCRKAEETTLIREIIQKKFRCTIDFGKLFYDDGTFEEVLPSFGGLVWTKAFRRLGTLIRESIKYGEPVLLVGETGCGKTTICQYFAAKGNTSLGIVNCHMNTESADFLGSLRPNRSLGSEDGNDSALFEWVDGPLIRAMKEGSYLLVDEISLADDSVLERLNSVLEFERTIFLAESADAVLISAEPSFRYFATMNPGGDYGKKELSPALRDRFTEIWCPVYEDEGDIRQIIEHNLAMTIPAEQKLAVSLAICTFIGWYQADVLNLKQSLPGPAYSIRDILTWVNFINQSCEQLGLREAFAHGACLVLVDALGTCNTNTRNFLVSSLQSARATCERKLQEITSKLADHQQQPKTCADQVDSKFTVAPFSINKGNKLSTPGQYYWQSSGVQMNLFRLMRALQLDKPILLEGPPGVGKTSLVQALAGVTGHSLIRINLSEQTDIADLFGCDLPLEGEGSAGKFAFRDGPLLKALKSESTWILLDELNLASQTVLEGLNACLDHRGEIYIPELNRTFHLNKAQSRIFASQNPFSMDGSRKGLPKSFLNRFTVVYVDHLGDEDFAFILGHLYANLGPELITRMIQTNRRICDKVLNDGSFARKGGPFEFNLRDLLRWAEVTSKSARLFGINSPELFFDLIYTNKMRTKADRQKIQEVCFEEFAYRKDARQIAFYFGEKSLQFGHSVVERLPGLRDQQHVGYLFETHKQAIESVLKCIEMNWMAILVGAAGSGKTTIVQMMAQLCGQRLTVFSVNSEMDTNDLLGGFEQKDFAVDLKDLEENLLATAYRLVKLETANLKMLSRFLSLRSQLKRSNLEGQSMDDFMSFKVQLLKSILALLGQTTTEESEELVKLGGKLAYLEKVAANRQLVNGAFEWKDSQLIKCIEAGGWLLIDNANQLNASVLDRLNSLLEDEGTLVINEKGSVDGELVQVRAHPNFRLFLTTNPQYGELSRAMRNRGIEIVLPDTVDDRLVSLLQQNRPEESLLLADYSATFRSIYESALKSQHGFYSPLEVDLQIESSAVVPLLRPLCINSVIADSAAFYVLGDFSALNLAQLSDTFGTKLRLFLESASLHDISLRFEVLASCKLTAGFEHQIERQQFDLLKMKDFLLAVFDEQHCQAVVQFLPVDLRENGPLFKLTCSSLSAENINLLNCQLNAYHLSFYQADLEQRLRNVTDPTNSMMALGEKVSSGQVNAKLYPPLVVPIYNALLAVKSQVADQLMSCGQIDDNTVPTLRSQLLWTARLAESCHAENLAVDWNLFIQEVFFPLWFMFNEQIVPLLASENNNNNSSLTQLIGQVNALLKLNNCTFNAVKFELLKQLTVNYFHFNSEHDIDLFSRLAELRKLLLMSSQKTSVAERNSISAQCANLLSAYYAEGEETSFEDASKEVVQLCNKLQLLQCSLTHDTFDGEVISMSETEERILVKSDLLMSSVFYAKLLNAFVSQEAQLGDVMAMFQANSIATDPLLLFASRVFQEDNRKQFIDIYLYLLGSMNEHFSMSSVIEYFIDHSTTKDDHKPLNSFFSPSLVSKSANLTVEVLPLLSLTCFNIYQIESISAEEFFSKSFTLDFYMSFLVQNYATFKQSTGSLFVDKFTKIANTLQQQLHHLDPSVDVQPLKLTSTEDTEVDKYFSLISVGYLIASSTAIDFPIDPIVRSHAILENCKAETSLLQEELTLRVKLKEAKFGTNTDTLESALMVSLEDCLKTKQAILASTSLPSRLSTSKYFYLKSDMDQFVKTIFNWQHLQPLATNLLQCLQNESTPRGVIDRAIRASVNCQHSLAKFVKHIEVSYRNYADLSSPFMVGVSLVLKGLQLATFALQSRSNTSECFASFESSSMATLTGTFFTFLNTHCPHEIGEFILANDCINKFASIASKLAIEEKSLIVSLLKSAFLEIENSIYLGYDRKYLLSLYLDIVNLFVQWWSHAKQQEEMEKIKNESTFHMKLADEPDDANLREVFPSFEDRFRDLIDDDKNFRDLSKSCSSGNVDPNALKENIELNLSKETLLFIIRSHMKLITLTGGQAGQTLPDMFQPYLIRYQILSNIFKKTLGFVDLNIESGLIDGHILVNKHLSELKGTSSEQEDRPINVYRESLVSQTRQCFAVLEKLKRKVITELLPQFENHPTLQKLLKVIDRVYKIEVNASLLSFATGLEVILKTGEDWQLIAHRGISLIEHLNEITCLLVEWRKLEIKYWGYCLQSVIERTEEHELVTWWYHFYMALQDMAEGGRTNDQQAVSDFVGSVMRFIERSSLGQFEVRLCILSCFVHQLRQSEGQSARGLLLTSLENLHRFYGHFAQQVARAIESERTPIEKEIKEFVKISKWNPNNFWSLKASLDKSHSQLYGYMKKFELAMNKPANAVFSFEKGLRANTWKMTFDLVYESQLSETEVEQSLKLAVDSAEECSVLAKHTSYTLRADKLCRKVVRMCARGPLKTIEQLEDVNNELICSINEYASLKVVAPIDDLVKWKKAAGLVQNRKRRALADLFTQLANFGLSFRKGLVTSNELNVSLMISSIYPLTGEGQFEEKEASANLIACNTYFYKCLSGLMKFVGGIRSEVNPQITPDARDRMEGFTTELARVVADQRMTASQEVDRFSRLNDYLRTIEQKCRGHAHNRLMNASQMKAAFEDAQQLLTKFISFSIRLCAVLQSLQSTNLKNNNSLIIAQASDFSSLNTTLLDDLIADLRSTYSAFQESTSTVFYTVVDVETLQDVADKLRSSFDAIKRMLKDSEEGGNLLTIYSEHLAVFEDRIASLDGQLQQLSQQLLMVSEESLITENNYNNTKQCSSIIKKILLSVQRTYSCLEKCQKCAASKSEEEEEADNKELVRQKLIYELLSGLNSFKMDAFICQFFRRLNEDSNERAALNYQLVCALKPFLAQYMSLYRSALTLVFGSLKSSSKMLHILLSLFNELLANGFCLPPEPNEKKEKSQLKDIQNSGFGTGDTSEAKDVSDRLDCQDQLDELAKNEQEEDANDESPNDDKNDDKGVEMDDDFEGKENGGEQEEEEKDGKEEEEDENEDQFDDKMGNVDDEEEMLDEKLWGDESEEEDNADELDESEQTGGKDNIESEIVANESNQDLKENDEENAESDEEEAKPQDSEEINENEMNDEYQGENPDKYKDSGAEEKPEENPDQKMELPEDINLDDDDQDGEDADNDDGDDKDKMDTDEVKEEEEEGDEGVPNMDDIEMLDEKGQDELKDDQEEKSNFDVNTEDKESEAQLDESKPNINYNDSSVANFDQQNSANAVEQNEPMEDEQEKQETANTEPSSGRKNQDKISESTSAQTAQPENEQSTQDEQSVSKNNKNTRSLADDVHKAKRQKIMHSRENKEEKEDSQQKDKQPSDTYRHVDDAKKANDVAYDMALPEEFEEKTDQQMEDAERGVQFADEPEVEEATEEDDEMADQQTNRQERKKKETTAGESEEQKQDSAFAVQGELVPTMSAARPEESTYHQTDPLNLLSEEVNGLELEQKNPLEPMEQGTETVLSDAWRQCEQKVEPLVYELCNQLQLVLEPTKCAKFKGDYKSGKRLNMRKVIAYVASDFRKDKIWLRRSKPSKRQYQILIAVDDSLSMDDNHSKQMAAESLILLGKSLSIIESGALSVLSFGEVVRVLHSFSEPFTDQSAFKMFSKFSFNQQQTQITEMLQCSLGLFSRARQSSNGRAGNSSNVYQLLLIVSDGRGINSEGNEHLQRAILKLKESNIFTVFLIIDNPEHEKSILDIQRAVFRTDDTGGGSKGRVVLSSYIEQFPFPYYVILKDINSLPSILGEALRQWFEMITYEVQ